MRHLIIGDIHGCITELEELIEMFKPEKGDQIICVGDILNRYNDSSQVLEYLKKIEAISVIGNHEMWFLHNTDNYNSLSPTKKKRVNNLNAYDHYNWIREWPFIIEREHFIVLHAGILPHTPLYKNTPQTLISLRDFKGLPWYKNYTGDKQIFYGHWAKQGFHTENKTVCLDGGCVYGKKMIGCIASEEKFTYINVAAKRVYEKIAIKK